MLRSHRARLFVLLLVTPLLATSGGAAAAVPIARPVSDMPAIQLELVTRHLSEPVDVTHAGDGSGRLFVVEKKGRIRIVRDGELLPGPFLDITPSVSSKQSEEGLLTMAFHPKFASNRRFYLHYINLEGSLVVSRFQVSADSPDVADPNSEIPLLVLPKQDQAHNGSIHFGPDGYLYIGIGDGGGTGDPSGNAQNKEVLFGKILRIDVDNASPYAIPPDNPFADAAGAGPEIWAYGLRNPWRFSFDRATRDLYIADVGQRAWEEIDFQPAGAGGGQNYGWNVMEGNPCFQPRRGGPEITDCIRTGLQPAISEYSRALGCAVIGGHVYRGQSFPQFVGRYFYADFCSGRLWALERQGSDEWVQQDLLTTHLLITSFGEDDVGELYLTTLADGRLYRLVAAT